MKQLLQFDLILFLNSFNQPSAQGPILKRFLRLVLYISTRFQALLVYLLVNSILKILAHLQMLYSELEDQQSAPPI